MRHTVIAVVGAGSVGTTAVYAIMLRDIAAEIILIDINEKKCRGEILDLQDVLSLSASSLVRSGTIDDVKDADIVIIAAGAPQRVNQSRTELVHANACIVSDIMRKMDTIHTSAIFIMITNPVDVMTLVALQAAPSIEKGRIFGSGTYLDSLRLRGLIANELHIAQESIHAYIIGEHGDSQIAVWSNAHVDGILLSSFHNLTKNKLDDFAVQTKNKAYEIISCKGATYYGIATVVADLCQTIIFNQKKVIPLSVYLDDYGICLSMPVVLGELGIESYLSLMLNDSEKKAFEESVCAIKDVIVNI